jgi:hypothetical protein
VGEPRERRRGRLRDRYGQRRSLRPDYDAVVDAWVDDHGRVAVFRARPPLDGRCFFVEGITRLGTIETRLWLRLSDGDVVLRVEKLSRRTTRRLLRGDELAVEDVLEAAVDAGEGT